MHSDTSTSTNIIRFPDRRQSCIWLLHDGPEWFAIAPGAHGWMHTSSCAAYEDALWLSANFGFPIREPAQASSW
jgi:hypothetical protein